MVSNDLNANSDSTTTGTTKRYVVPEDMMEFYTWGSGKSRFDKVYNDYVKNRDVKDTLMMENELNDAAAADEHASFASEVHDSILFGTRDNLPPESIILEINSSKHAYNLSVEDMLTHIIPVSMEIALSAEKLFQLKPEDAMNHPLTSTLDDENTSEEILQNYEKVSDVSRSCCSIVESPTHQYELLISNLQVFSTIKRLLKHYVREEELKNTMLTVIEDYFYISSKEPNKTYILKYFIKFVHDLYEADVLDAEEIMSWNEASRVDLLNSERPDANQQLKFRDTHLSKLLNWLQESSSSEDDEYDSSESPPPPSSSVK